MHPDKLKAIQWARDALQLGDFVLLDTETTGLAADDEIVQITILDRQGNVLLDTLVEPTKDISAETQTVHHITPEGVANAPTFAEVYARIKAAIGNQRVVIYNAAFDTRIVAQTCARYGLPPIVFKADCAILQYAAFCGEWTRRGWKWQPLQGGDHSAQGDCLAILRIIEEMAK